MPPSPTLLLAVAAIALLVFYYSSAGGRLGQAKRPAAQAKAKAKGKRIERPPPGKATRQFSTRTGRLVKPRATAGSFRQPTNAFRPAAAARTTVVKNNSSRPEPLVVPEPLSRIVQPGVRPTN